MPILLVASLICFVLATFGLPTGRINTVALGLVFYVLHLLFPGGRV